MKNLIFLETPRLVLRRFADSEADARLLFELDRDPEVMRYIGPYALPTVEAYREKIRVNFFSHYSNHPARGCWAAEEKPGRGFIGWFMLRPALDYRFAPAMGWTRSTDVEVGYRLKQSAWGRGLATEATRELVRIAFTDPDVTAVVACAMRGNLASRRVLEKAGLAFVADVTRPGESDTDVTYALERP